MDTSSEQLLLNSEVSDAPPKMKGKKAIPLLNHLRIIDNSVEWEKTFDWLYLPKTSERTDEESNILKGLISDCSARKSSFTNRKRECNCQQIYSNDEKIKGITRKLEFDFFLPSLNIAIEFDEAQHFTLERKLTYSYYPNTRFNYDIERWEELCSQAKKDPDPPCRDWQRAFRDAVRDIRAAINEVTLIRLYEPEFNEKSFNNGNAADRLNEVLKPFL